MRYADNPIPAMAMARGGRAHAALGSDNLYNLRKPTMRKAWESRDPITNRNRANPGWFAPRPSVGVSARQVAGVPVGPAGGGGTSTPGPSQPTPQHTPPRPGTCSPPSVTASYVRRQLRAAAAPPCAAARLPGASRRRLRLPLAAAPAYLALRAELPRALVLSAHNPDELPPACSLRALADKHNG